MTNSRMTDPAQTSSTGNVLAALRAWSGSRLGLLSIAGVAIVAGLGFNWSWLVAIGVAPLILAVLPCAAMCALGLCMMGMGRKGAAPGPSNDAAQGAGSTPLSRPDIAGSSKISDSADASTNAG